MAIADGNIDKLLKYLQDVELVANDILSEKHQLVDLDRKRQQNREALRALVKQGDGGGRTWVCMGNTFFRLNTGRTSTMIEHDQSLIEKEISETRKSLKVKIDRLREMEGKAELRGFKLQPLDKKEIEALSSVL